MIVRTRVSAILLPLAFHAFSAAVGGFFVWHAFHGDRGIAADIQYRRQMAGIEAKLKVVRAEKAEWRKRIDLLRGPDVDRDLLDEEARNLLNRVGKSDLVIFLPARRPSPPRAGRTELKSPPSRFFMGFGLVLPRIHAAILETLPEAFLEALFGAEKAQVLPEVKWPSVRLRRLLATIRVWRNSWAPATSFRSIAPCC